MSGPAGRRGRAVALGAVVLVLAAGCTARPAPGAPTASGCGWDVSTADAAEQALSEAQPGDTVCVTGEGLRDADLVLRRSGEPGRPIVLAAEDAQVRSITVMADAVTVRGFDVTGGDGIVLLGAGLVAEGNTVRDAAEDGISCEEDCTDVLIEDNTVVGADGSGIIVEGRDITVRGNTVSGSVRREAGDADGIRFFGSGVQVLGNTVTDISDDGYAGEPPHTDCFQTYDNSRLPTVDAVVADNVCRDVDHQCLIATAAEAGAEDEIGRSRGLQFTGNECDVGGSQAVLVQWFPEVTVRDNTFQGPGLHRAAYFLDGSTGAEFVDNTVPEGVSPFQIDEESEPGFTTDQAD